MKFNLKLDESLFDDDIDSFLVDSKLDDEPVEYHSEHSIEDVLPGPNEGSDTGIATELISLINDEWEAIQGYNNAIATLRANISSNPFYEDAIKVLEEISSEENVHVGQLEELLKQISPNAREITKGEDEAKKQLGLVGGILPVESWDAPVISKPAINNDFDENCTLCDVDDDM